MSNAYQTITLNAPHALAVSIAGTFTDWTLVPMARAKDDDWEFQVRLAPGRHEFKFFVDGRWCCDVGPDGPREVTEGCVHNPFGTVNRVLDVPAPHAAARDEAPVQDPVRHSSPPAPCGSREARAPHQPDGRALLR